MLMMVQPYAVIQTSAIITFSWDICMEHHLFSKGNMLIIQLVLFWIITHLNARHGCLILFLQCEHYACSSILIRFYLDFICHISITLRLPHFGRFHHRVMCNVLLIRTFINCLLSLCLRRRQFHVLQKNGLYFIHLVNQLCSTNVDISTLLHLLWNSHLLSSIDLPHWFYLLLLCLVTIDQV